MMKAGENISNRHCAKVARMKCLTVKSRLDIAYTVVKQYDFDLYSRLVEASSTVHISFHKEPNALKVAAMVEGRLMEIVSSLILEKGYV
jgi:hypothetical protein